MRGREKQVWRLAYLLAAALMTGAGFLAGGALCALICLGGSLLILLLVFFETRARRQRIAAFTKKIDRLLHGAEKVDLSDYAEGELAILQNEIGKLTLELRHRADALTQDRRELKDFLANVSHQLRTPMTAMGLAVSTLSQPELAPGPREETLRDLQRMLARMDWLITALLKMAQLDSSTARFREEPVSVRTLVEKAAEPLAIPMELREQKLSVAIEGDPGFKGDPAWSAEALGNILKNCMEHTPAGGAITVRALENALYCGITVEDTGPGIDPEDLPHLFERFYRGKNAADNSIGIGLALTRMIAARQNGTVKAENLPQGGARFTLRFYKEII